MNRIRRLDDDANELAELPVEISTGAADAGKIPALNESGQLDASMVPSGAGGTTYVHDQSIPSDEWVIPHGLSCFPSVTVVDTAGERWWSDVVYDSANQLTVRHAAPFSGKAYLNR